MSLPQNSELNQHLQALLKNTSKYQTTTDFNNFGFVVDGPTEDPIANIKAIKPEEPVQMYSFMPFKHDVGRALGKIMPMTDMGARVLQQAFLTEKHGQPCLQNRNHYRIERDCALVFDEIGIYEPMDISLTNHSNLILGENVIAKNVTLTDFSFISAETNSELTDSIFANTVTGKPVGRRFQPEPVLFNTSLSAFINSEIANTHNPNLISNANIYNTHLENAELIDTTVGLPEAKVDPKQQPNFLKDTSLTNVRLINAKPFNLADVQMQNTALTARQAAIKMHHTTLNNSYISDTGLPDLAPASEIVLNNAKIDHLITNQPLNCHDTEISASSKTPIVSAAALTIAYRKLAYPKGAIVTKSKKPLDIRLAPSGLQQPPKSFKPVNPQQKAYQQLAQLNATKNNAKFENDLALIDPDNDNLPAEQTAALTPNALLDTKAVEATDCLFTAAQAAVITPKKAVKPAPEPQPQRSSIDWEM